jgi:hypothetical protein
MDSWIQGPAGMYGIMCLCIYVSVQGTDPRDRMTKHTIHSLWVVFFFLFNFSKSDKVGLAMYTRLLSNSHMYHSICKYLNTVSTHPTGRISRMVGWMNKEGERERRRERESEYLSEELLPYHFGRWKDMSPQSRSQRCVEWDTCSSAVLVLHQDPDIPLWHLSVN